MPRHLHQRRAGEINYTTATAVFILACIFAAGFVYLQQFNTEILPEAAREDLQAKYRKVIDYANANEGEYPPTDKIWNVLGGNMYDLWGNPIEYEYDGLNQPRLISHGRDGRAGGEGPDADISIP